MERGSDGCDVCRSWLEEHGRTLDIAKKAKNLESELKAAREELAMEHVRLKESTSREISLREQLAGRMNVETNLRTDIATLHDEVKLLVKDNEGLRSGRAELRETAQARKQQVRELKQRIKLLAEETKKLLQHNDELQQSLSDANGKQQQQATSLRGAQSTIDGLEERASTAQRTIARQKAEVQAAERKLQEGEHTLARMKAHYRGQTSEIERLEGELQKWRKVALSAHKLAARGEAVRKRDYRSSEGAHLEAAYQRCRSDTMADKITDLEDSLRVARRNAERASSQQLREHSFQTAIMKTTLAEKDNTLDILAHNAMNEISDLRTQVFRLNAQHLSNA